VIVRPLVRDLVRPLVRAVDDARVAGGDGPIITATTAPVLGPLAAGDAVSDAFTAGVYASTAGTIASQDVTVLVNGSPEGDGLAYVVAEGDVVQVQELVTDSEANTRTFSTGQQTVPWIAPALTGNLTPQTVTENTGVQTYDASVGFTGTALVYSLVSPPAGVTINASTGVVSIDTDATGLLDAEAVTVRATNPGGSAEDSFALTVSDLVQVVATGGTESNLLVGSQWYRLHEFTTSGDFVVTTGGDVEFVQAGSGGGCARDNNAGAAFGGASGGQVRKYVAGEAGNTEAGPIAVTPQTYPIVVPAGGSGSTDTSVPAGAGSSCTGLGLTAVGGVGSPRPNNTTAAEGLPGYNASGASARINIQALGGVGTNRSGGNSKDDSTTFRQSGGGGAGQSGDGIDGVIGTGGNGGTGLKTSITGTEIGLGGGGGGATHGTTPGTATDGGGAGANTASTAGANGTANRGGGAGGSRGANVDGANGGSGYFAIRYPIAAPL